MDDGSTDNSTSAFIENSKLKVIKIKSNSGKSNAVFTGLKEVTNENLLLLDSDLTGLMVEELDRALARFLEEKSLDMLILKIGGANSLIDNLFRKYIFQGGNRILKKSDLEKVEKLRPVGYQLEVATNQFMLESGKAVKWINFSARNPHKLEKFGIFEGLKKEFIMDLSIIRYLGFLNYWRQICCFSGPEARLSTPSLSASHTS